MRLALDIIRSVILRILTFYFRIVPLPDSLKKTLSGSSEELSDLCIITESESLILEALLRSFAERLDLNLTHFLKNSEAPARGVRWTALHNTASLEAIASGGKPLKLTTLNIFSGRGPFRANPAYRLGFWELTGILILGRFLIIFLGKPITFDPGHVANVYHLRRILRIDFYKNLKQVRGTPFQSIQAQERMILGGNKFQLELTQLSDKISMPRHVLFRKARHAFYEIAANPRRPMYRILAFIVNFINKRLFSSINSLGLDELKTVVREKTVVLVPMHRSHLDYLLIGSELYRAHFIPPLVAAGINLSFWPAGFLIRSVGAYFVKRNVGSDRLHALILKRYVTYLVRRGHMQEFFIEGGRSRSGRMRQPKVGLLSIFIDAYLKGYKDDIAFVPVSLTYENVIEDSVYGQENTGREKTKESLLGLFRASGIFKKRYGDVVINFGPAISLKEHLGAPPGGDTAKVSVINFALHLTRKIREQTNPSLTSLLHSALLMSPAYGLKKAELIQATLNLGRLLEIVARLNPNSGAFTPSLKQFIQGHHWLLDDLASSSTIKTRFCLGSEVFYIPGDRRFTADFYKNSTLHLFFEISLFSLLDLMEMDISDENLEKFYIVFVSDFILPEKRAFFKECKRLAEELVKEGILQKKAGRLSFAVKDPGIYIPSLLFASIESINWCLRVLKTLGRENDGFDQDDEVDGKVSVDYNKAMNVLLHEFRTAGYLGVTQCTEASSSVAINSALETLQLLGVIFVANKQSKAKKIIIKDLNSAKIEIIKKADKAIKVWKAHQGL